MMTDATAFPSAPRIGLQMSVIPTKSRLSRSSWPRCLIAVNWLCNASRLIGVVAVTSHSSRMRSAISGVWNASIEKSPSVWLTTNSENAPAIAFYLKQGFEKVGTTHFRIQDEGYLNDVFRRVVSP
jgi:hypothetical protein